MSTGNAGSVCVYPGCFDAPPGDGDDEAWFSIGRLPDEVPNLWAPDGHESREFIVARDYGAGHVLVYAQDGLTRDDEVRGLGADNLTFAENALRWLDDAGEPEGCADTTTIVFWPGTFLRPDQMRGCGASSIGAAGDSSSPARRSLDADLELRLACLWYASDWDPPADFADASTSRASSGSCARAAGCSSADSGGPTRSRDPMRPYAADQLGEPFGFKFSLNAFQANARQPIPLLVP